MKGGRPTRDRTVIVLHRCGCRRCRHLGRDNFALRFLLFLRGTSLLLPTNRIPPTSNHAGNPEQRSLESGTLHVFEIPNAQLISLLRDRHFHVTLHPVPQSQLLMSKPLKLQSVIGVPLKPSVCIPAAPLLPEPHNLLQEPRRNDNDAADREDEREAKD